MSMMISNGILTSELCPFCDNPEPVMVRHGVNDNGSFVHDYDCDECGGEMSIVGYLCLECAVSQPTQDAGDLAKAESEKWFDYGVSLGIANADDVPPSA